MRPAVLLLHHESLAAHMCAVAAADAGQLIHKHLGGGTWGLVISEGRGRGVMVKAPVPPPPPHVIAAAAWPAGGLLQRLWLSHTWAHACVAVGDSTTGLMPRLPLLNLPICPISLLNMPMPNQPPLHAPQPFHPRHPCLVIGMAYA